jgi:probable F420-dependent oxidoreductase
MKFGAVFPTTEFGNDPAAIRDWAQAAEQLGYDFIATYDHVLGAVHEGREPKLTGPYTENDPFHEPMTLFAYLAAVTQRVELVTSIIILPQRQTVLFAKQAAEVDLLSSGRLRVGVGTGWNYPEYEALGVPWQGRGKRYEEQIDLLRRLWSERILDFEGDFHRIDRAGILPQPARSIPIWFGAFAKGPIERAARMGDGLLLGSPPSWSKKMLATLDEALAHEGRSRTDFGTEASIDFSHGPETWAKEIESWRELGGTHLSLRAMDTAVEVSGGKHMGYDGPQAYIDVLRTFAKATGLGS